MNKKLFLFILLICSIFYCDRVLALEVKNPDTSISKNNIVWYGYYLPTRPTLTDSLGSNVHLSVSYRPGNGGSTWKTSYSDSLKFGVRDLDDDILNYLSERNIPLSTLNINDNKIWSQTYQMNDTIYDYSFVFGFRPGNSVSSDTEVLENGYDINYDSLYSYSFDIIVFNQNYSSGILTQLLEYCNFDDNSNNFSCINRGNQAYTVIPRLSGGNLEYYTFKVNMTNYFNPPGFNDSVISEESSNFLYGISYGKNLFHLYNSFLPSTTKIIFSQPYNITLWNHDSSITCSNKCWTQADTDSNQRIVDQNPYLWNTLNDISLDFNYHGFSGIVNLTFNTIISLLQDANHSCVDLTIPILSTSVSLPSSCTFWSRNDVSSFESFTNMLWIGIISYFVCWRIFKDILKIYSPDSKIVDGNEVEDL